MPLRSPRPWLKHLPAALLAMSGVGLTVGLVAGERNPLRPAPAARSATNEQARVIVRYKPAAGLLRTHAAQAGSGRALRYAQALAARHGLALSDGRMLAERMQLVLGSGIGSQALAAKLAADPDVEWAAVDGRRHALVAPNDPLYPNGLVGTTPAAGQWYLRATSGGVKSSIHVEPAWNLATGSGVTVAVLDTGITSHADLNSKVVQGYDFVGYAVDSVATANDGDLDDADPHDPGDWITAAEDQSGEFEDCGESDSSWHGTQVAGIVGAVTNNGVGMAGIARDAQVLPVRVLGKCGGYDSDIVAGMYWAAGLSGDGSLPVNSNPAKVLNLSLGSQDECNAAYQAAMADLTAAGVVVVAAAGNDGLAVGTPANCPGMVAVAGLRHIGSKVGFSNLGPEITVGAPGGNCVNEVGTCLYPLLTTVNTGTKGPVAASYSDGDNHLTLGTSFSSPIVAGTVALMLQANPALTPAQVTSALKTSARAYPTTGGDSGSTACTAPTDTPQDSECYCTTSTCGAGMTDANGAVTRAKTGPFPAVTASRLTTVAGGSVALNSAGSSVLAGRSIASYQWTITTGDDLASFTSATNASTATVKTTGAGHVEVKLTLTDNLGASTSIRQPLDVSASALAAAINASPIAPEAGDNVALNASSSVVDAGRSITAYKWEITSGATLASFSGATNAATATLATTTAGSVTVRLTITDSTGLQASTSRTLTISPAASDGGGGGGAMSPVWALGLLVAALGLRRRPK
ncbi:MAG TPA: S8 family serine peptidase [Ideonella sp.]|uniref:S8 family peptidase n=1 Tax=Ideonella sp. TaxID=1929293 RepID=UPI002E37FBF1|nr:S8 family serine peptidase [Ideonella sp.]HEX5682665.1 S8 family serine peptidase [Ideonella sp.]